MNESGADKTPVFISVLNPVGIHEHLSHPLRLLPSGQGNNNRYSNQ
jgi:hypothetical protein